MYTCSWTSPCMNVFFTSIWCKCHPFAATTASCSQELTLDSLFLQITQEVVEKVPSAISSEVLDISACLPFGKAHLQETGEDFASLSSMPMCAECSHGWRLQSNDSYRYSRSTLATTHLNGFNWAYFGSDFPRWGMEVSDASLTSRLRRLGPFGHWI